MSEDKVDRGDEIIEETTEETTEATAEEVSEEKNQAAEATSEETGVEEADDEVAEPKEPMLPKSRYDSVKAQNRELEARIEELEKAGKDKEAEAKREEQVNDLEKSISDLDVAYAEAFKEGDADEMARVRRQQREAERELIRAEMKQTGESSTQQAREQVRLDLTIDALEEQYPALDPGNKENYDKAIVNEIMELRQGFEATGKYTPTQALLRAVKFVLPENTVKEAETPREEPKPKTDAKNLRNKVDAANKQPPDTDSVGEQGNSMGKNAEDPNPLDMSEEDWDALPESTLKRMRGDLY